MGKEKDPKSQSAYYDYEGENETSQLITDAYSSGVVEQQYEQNFLQENLQPRDEDKEQFSFKYKKKSSIMMTFFCFNKDQAKQPREDKCKKTR